VDILEVFAVEFCSELDCDFLGLTEFSNLIFSIYNKVPYSILPWIGRGTLGYARNWP